MEELKMEHALDILNRRIAKYMKEHKVTNIDEFKNRLKEFAKEEEEIYQLNENTINRVIDVYLKEIKEQEN